MSVNPGLRLENRIDVVLALLGAGGVTEHEAEPVVGITRLMKLLFLLQEEAGIKEALREEYFDFQPYDAGPFDARVYDAIEFLKDLKLVEAERTPQSAVEDAVERSHVVEQVGIDAEDDDQYTPPEAFRLTRIGQDVARQLLEKMPEDTRRMLEQVKRQYNVMPLRDLLRHVYTRYPSSATRSKIRAELGLEKDRD